jgi:aminopeptidase N
LIISKNKFGDRTFFADNWPNRAHHWIPCNDRPDDKATFEFVANVPEHYFVISNGLQKDITVNNKVEGKEYIYAGKKMVHWKEDIALPTKVMVIGAAKFAVKEYPNSPTNLPVSAWVYPQDSTKGFYDFAIAPEIVQYFSNYIAPFPYKKLANVQSTTIFGGMENASCIFYAEDLVTGDRRHEDVVAHEIAHQWFGDMASEKSFAHLWLSEGFAVYFTDLWFEYKYGKDSAIKRLKKEREQVITFAKRSDHAVVDTTDKLMSLLNPNSYQKGGWILHMIRNEVGDSTFKKIIQTYYNQYKGSNAETRDFQKVVEKLTGKNWKPFFDQWLYRPRIPQLMIDKKIENDEVKLRITQQGVKFDFPLEVSFVRADGSILKETIAVNSQLIEYKIKVPDVKSVIIDPDTKLLYAEVK